VPPPFTFSVRRLLTAWLSRTPRLNTVTPPRRRAARSARRATRSTPAAPTGKDKTTAIVRARIAQGMQREENQQHGDERSGFARRVAAHETKPAGQLEPGHESGLPPMPATAADCRAIRGGRRRRAIDDLAHGGHEEDAASTRRTPSAASASGQRGALLRVGSPWSCHSFQPAG